MLRSLLTVHPAVRFEHHLHPTFRSLQIISLTNWQLHHLSFLYFYIYLFISAVLHCFTSICLLFCPPPLSFLILYQHFLLLLSSLIFHILPLPGILSGVFLTACFGEGAYRSNGRHLSPLILSREEILILCSRESPLSILYLSSIYPLSILYLSSIYPLPILYLSSTYPLSLLYLSSIYLIPILYLSSIYPLSILYLSSTYPLSILYLYSIYPLPILYLSSILHKPHSVNIPCSSPIQPQQPIDGWLRRKIDG